MQVALKVSRYTHVFEGPDGFSLVYNTLTGNLIKLRGDERGLVARALSAGEARDEFPGCESFVSMGFLVDDDIDELNVVKEVWKEGRRKKGQDAMLTILPTLGCNFDCPYCFERHTKGMMPSDVQDALVKFTKERLVSRTKGLSIEWFGGEPLIGFPVIESLTKRFRKIAEVKGLPPPSASITTNGYLLKPEMYGKLMALGITSAQVTLDGPAEVHDRRRPLVGGRGTFARIIDNIKNAPEGFSISIRINVDAGNKDHAFPLLALLDSEGILPRMGAYVAKVESFSQECRSSEGVFMSPQEYAEFKREMTARCREAGIPWMSDDPPRMVAYGVCIVDQPKGFVVQPNGELLKCWADAGNAGGVSVAHLLKEKTWRRIDVSPLQSRDPFDDEECCECSILPACMGGCPRIRENLRGRGIKRCPPLRYSLRDEVLALYQKGKSGAADSESPLRLSI